MKQKLFRLFWLRAILFNMFLSMFIGSVRAETVISKESTVLNETYAASNDSENMISPCDIITNEGIWAVFKSATAVYLAPYDTGNAPSGYTFEAGNGAFVRGRVYNYYYVYFYVNGKEMYGYVPISTMDVSGWIWISYDIYGKGNCIAETPVLSGPGTANTYIQYSEPLSAGQSPLLILGQTINGYNNKKYYYVQYETSTGLAKRGWIDSTLGTVTLVTYYGSDLVFESQGYAFINQKTGNALTWDYTTNTVENHPFMGTLNQIFLIDIQENSHGASDYYSKIIPIMDENIALRISSTGYADGLTLTTTNRNGIDKCQEFYVSPTVSTVIKNDGEVKTRVCNVTFFSRSTGFNRFLVAQSDGSVKQTNQTSDVDDDAIWRIVAIGDSWGGTYGQYGGSKNPSDFYVYYDSSVSNVFALSQHYPLLCWNDVYSDMNLSWRTSYSKSDTNCLAYVTKGNVEATEKGDPVGQCVPIIYVNSKPYESVNSGLTQWDWHSTKIVLDIDKMNADGYQNGDIMNVFLHELGHSLKLSHVFFQFEWTTSTDAGSWNCVSMANNIMNDSIGPTAAGESVIELRPSALDGWRLEQKWEGIS